MASTMKKIIKIVLSISMILVPVITLIYLDFLLNTPDFKASPALARLPLKRNCFEVRVDHGRKVNFDIQMKSDRLIRSLKRSTFEQWIYFRRGIKSMLQDRNNVTAEMNSLLQNLQDGQRDRHIKSCALISNLGARGEKIKEYKNSLAEKLEKKVQNQLQKSQNPKNCSDAKLLFCDDPKLHFYRHGRRIIRHGWTCLVYFLIYCLQLAVATNRVMIFDETAFKLSGHFLPLTTTCNYSDIVTNLITSKQGPPDILSNAEEKIIQVSPTKKYRLPREISMKLAPPFIPHKFLRELRVISHDPPIWLAGQVAKFILMPNPDFQSQYNHLKNVPCKAAIHVRRSDKVQKKEDIFWPTSEYMDHVEDYFDILESRNLSSSINREVCVATDDVNVFNDLRLNYSNFKVIGEEAVASAASVFQSRHQDNHFHEFLIDFFRLVFADLTVCSFSSNVCSLVYKLKMAYGMEDLYDLVSISRYGTREDYQKMYKARHDSISKRNKGLKFLKGNFIVRKRLVRNKVEANLGFNTNKKNTGYFVRAALKRWFDTSDVLLD